jgi:hypothetical protein
MKVFRIEIVSILMKLYMDFFGFQVLGENSHYISSHVRTPQLNGL